MEYTTSFDYPAKSNANVRGFFFFFTLVGVGANLR